MDANRGGTSVEGAANNCWKAIWKLRLPSKIQVFAWRACHEILPTAANLTRRKVLWDDRCSVCTRETETTIHALWDCAAVQDIWAGSVRKLQKTSHGQLDMVHLMEELLERLSQDEIELFWTQAWFFWNQRNCLLHGGQLKVPSSLNKRAEEYLSEFREAQSRLGVQRAQQPAGDTWQPPPPGEFKMNFDAAIFPELGKTGFGAIIRNEKGEVMAAMSASGPMVRTSDEAEFLACRRAIEFAVDAGFSRMIIEGDNINVVQAISSSVENVSPIGIVVDDIRLLLRSLHWVSIGCIRRGGNHVAHVLAQYARNCLDEDRYWMEDSPPPAADALYRDVSLL